MWKSKNSPKLSFLWFSLKKWQFSLKILVLKFLGIQPMDTILLRFISDWKFQHRKSEMEVISKRHSLRTSQLNNQPEVTHSHRKSSSEKPSKLNSSHMVATSTPRSNRCEISVTNAWLIATSYVTSDKRLSPKVSCQQLSCQQ